MNILNSQHAVLAHWIEKDSAKALAGDAVFLKLRVADLGTYDDVNESYAIELTPNLFRESQRSSGDEEQYFKSLYEALEHPSSSYFVSIDIEANAVKLSVKFEDGGIRLVHGTILLHKQTGGRAQFIRDIVAYTQNLKAQVSKAEKDAARMRKIKNDALNSLRDSVTLRNEIEQDLFEKQEAEDKVIIAVKWPLLVDRSVTGKRPQTFRLLRHMGDSAAAEQQSLLKRKRSGSDEEAEGTGYKPHSLDSDLSPTPEEVEYEEQQEQQQQHGGYEESSKDGLDALSAEGSLSNASLSMSSDSAASPEKGGPKIPVNLPSGLVYDARLLAHAPLHEEDFDHPESPDRLRKIYEALKVNGFLYKFKRINVHQANPEQITRFHTARHFADMQQTAEEDAEYLINKAKEFNSIYLNAQSAFCASLSCGGVISLVDAVWSGSVKNGFAVVRPPGHHAEPDEPMGFCIYNNVAIAAMHLKAYHKASRIVIVDWDIHHGNGTQIAFYDDPEVLFISIHRYDGGRFYPGQKSADCTFVGGDNALGKNINIPWPCGGFGDADYLYAFQKVVMPVIGEFNPEIILVSCGFDAAQNDPIGACSVTPRGYEHMTYMLSQFANGKLVLALEGGYHLESVAQSSVACANVLLGNEPKSLAIEEVSAECIRTVDHVIKALSPYWKCFGTFDISVDQIREIGQDPNVDKRVAEDLQRANSLAFTQLRDILKSFRSARLKQMYSLSPITQLFYEASSFADIHISSDIFTANTSVLFIHDSPAIRFNSETSENITHNATSFLVDETFPYIDTFLNKKWGLIDVNLLNQQDKGYFPERYERIKSTSLREDAAERQRVERLLVDIFDRYVTSFSGRFFLIFVAGFATSCLQKLLARDSIDTRVESLVLVLPPGASPPFIPTAETQQKTKWYMQKSVILMPEDAEPWTTVEFPRCGIVWSTGKDSEGKLESVMPMAILRRYQSQIMKILEGRWWW